jgi:hypothetical protein
MHQYYSPIIDINLYLLPNKEEICALLILADLTKSYSSRTETVGLLDLRQ